MRPLVVSLFAVSVLGCSFGSSGNSPYAPENALATFAIHPDFEIELFAAEPDLADPVAMDFGPDGRIWIAENSGYPLDVDGNRGRIRVLEDTDGDGRPDQSTLFADRLTMPTGVMAYRNGVLVTDAPEVLYLADTDGDGRADQRDVLLTGFAFTNPQHTVSSPIYGLDNWIYLSNEGYTRAVVFSEKFGDTGSEIRFPGRPDGPTIPIARRSVRFRPDTFELELLAGPSQFGQTFSGYGELFTHNNTYHSRHEVIAARYLERNPNLAVTRTEHDIYAPPSPASVYPVTENPRFEILSGMGQMTSACGLTRYLGGAFPGYDDLAFVAEPVHNVVHADRWSELGATFTAEPLLDGEEFLASRDAWFRPVNFTVGPDGALYVVDYYRDVIEHPEWTSAETYESETLYDGADRGRIWRITPKGGLPLASANFAAMAADALVEELASPNVWRRRTAQRLLVERQADGVADALRRLTTNDDAPLAQAHALWTLEGLGELDRTTLLRAFESSEAGVRRNAILLAEPRLREAPEEWTTALLALGADPSAHVRLQLLLTLGEAPGVTARQLRDRLLEASLDDEWLALAALTWPEPNPARLYTNLAPKLSADSSLLGQVAGLAARETTALDAMLRAIERDESPERRAAALAGLARSVEPAAANQAIRSRLQAMATGSEAAVRDAALNALAKVGVGDGAILKDALATASEFGQDEQRRADAIRLLALADPDAYASRFRQWIDLHEPRAVQAAAVAAFGKTSETDVAPFLLEKWPELPGAARTAAARALVADESRAEALVVALEEGDVQPWMLEFAQRRNLIMQRDPGLRERARRALMAEESDREVVVERYQSVLATHPADPTKGRAVYERVCKECHQLNGRGAEVGPDLATVRTRPSVNILRDILIPNQSIAQTYEAYVIETKDGDVLDGVIGSQGPGFVTLRQEGGKTERIERSAIESMRAAKLSAMPADLDQQVGPEQMADLIRYLQAAQ